jgi:hypothetical protein
MSLEPPLGEEKQLEGPHEKASLWHYVQTGCHEAQQPETLLGCDLLVTNNFGDLCYHCQDFLLGHEDQALIGADPHAQEDKILRRY